MAFLNFTGAAAVSAPSGLWEWLILDVFSFVGNYGWAVVLFTVLLKLVLSPLDIYQRVAMKKNQRITKRIQPELDNLKKQYANNPQMLQAKQREINKREGYSILAGCLPMLVTLGITIWLLTSLTGISQYKNMANYVEMYKVYTAAEMTSYAQELTEDDVAGGQGQNVYLIEYDADGVPISFRVNNAAFGLTDEILNADESMWTQEQRAAVMQRSKYEYAAMQRAKSTAQAAVNASYDDVRESFLWVQNIWIADVPWQSAVMGRADFIKAVGKYATEPQKYYGVKNVEDVTAAERAAWSDMLMRYDDVTHTLQQDAQKNRANGFLVLPLLSIGVMLISQFLMRRMQQDSGVAAAGSMGAAGNSKMMIFIMPLIFGVFALMYTTAFSLYMIVNSSIMILVSLSAALVMRIADGQEEKTERVTDDGILRIGRPDPNEPKEVQKPSDKKRKK